MFNGLFMALELFQELCVGQKVVIQPTLDTVGTNGRVGNWAGTAKLLICFGCFILAHGAP